MISIKKNKKIKYEMINNNNYFYCEKLKTILFKVRGTECVTILGDYINYNKINNNVFLITETEFLNYKKKLINRYKLKNNYLNNKK